jgi:tetratricopeptide (TPR) repeat protein
MEALQQAYVDVAQRLGIPGWENDQADVKTLVKDYLSKKITQPWVLVFDNADSIDMWTGKRGGDPQSARLIEYLPRNDRGCILFTTRNKQAAIDLAHQNVVEIPELNEEAAKALLQKYLVHLNLAGCQAEVAGLLKQLEYLPLAIVQAATYVFKNGISIADYLSLLSNQEAEVVDLLSEDFEDDWRYHNMKNPVATTWLASFEQIQCHSPLAAEYLSLMACVDSRNIPQSFLPAGASQRKKIEAVGILEAYSFITKRSADASLDLHRLVHLATRNWLRKQGNIDEWTERAISRLEEEFPKSNSYEERNRWRKYLPHVRYTLSSNSAEGEGETSAVLKGRYGACLIRDTQYEEAETLLVDVTERHKRVYGEQHSYTLTTMNNLAANYWRQGKPAQAEELMTRMVEICKRMYGEQHPGTLTSINNLASTYWSQGRFTDAENLDLRALEARRKVLGEQHPQALASLSNLASTYFMQGRLIEAEQLMIEALEISETIHGEHPHTCLYMSNLAALYQKQGKLVEAEDLNVRVLEARTRLLGEQNCHTLTSMANLSDTLHSQGRVGEAILLLERCAKLQGKFLGYGHPDTIESLKALNEWQIDSLE